MRRFPEMGWIVEELGDPTIREIVFDRYRILYRYAKQVEVLRIWPGAKPLTPDRFESK